MVDIRSIPFGTTEYWLNEVDKRLEKNKDQHHNKSKSMTLQPRGTRARSEPRAERHKLSVAQRDSNSSGASSARRAKSTERVPKKKTQTQIDSEEAWKILQRLRSQEDAQLYRYED